MVIVCAQLCLIGAANPAAGEGGTPRFSFHTGEKLTYHISWHAVARSGPSAGVQQDLDARAVLHVLSVSGEAMAEIELVTWGKGRGNMGDQSIELTNDSPSRIVLIVRPTGTIAQVRDLNGNRIRFMSGDVDLSSGGGQAQVFVGMTYTLFGVQLPDKLPAPGGEWTGYHQRETASMSPMKPGEWQVGYKRVPVEYTFLGTRDHKGRACLTFSAELDIMDLKNVPATFYFDNANGRLVAWEMHVKRRGPSETDLDMSAVLITAE